MMRAIGVELTARYGKRYQSRWDASPWGWLRHLPPLAKAHAGRHMLSTWLATRGLAPSGNAPGRAIGLVLPNGHVAHVKTSMLWLDDDDHRRGGEYHFQQIRDGDYAHLLLFGLTPELAHLWIVPRRIALAKSVPMHSEESRMIVFRLDDVPDWLRPYGGPLRRALATLRESTAWPYREEE